MREHGEEDVSDLVKLPIFGSHILAYSNPPSFCSHDPTSSPLAMAAAAAEGLHGLRLDDEEDVPFEDGREPPTNSFRPSLRGAWPEPTNESLLLRADSHTEVTSRFEADDGEEEEELAAEEELADEAEEKLASAGSSKKLIPILSSG